jgi:hypothetical protein
MVGNNEDQGRSRRLGAEDRGWSSTGRVLSGRMIERLGDAVCGLHYAQGDEEHAFLGLASKQCRRFLPTWPQNQWLRFPLVWPQNRWLRFLWFGLKTTCSCFLVWASKPAAAVW